MAVQMRAEKKTQNNDNNTKWKWEMSLTYTAQYSNTSQCGTIFKSLACFNTQSRVEESFKLSLVIKVKTTWW